MGGTIKVEGFGNLSPAKEKSAPLLIVFGGVVVGGRTSGDYMWDYIGGIKDKYHIFVADGPLVKNPEDIHKKLLDTLQKNELQASSEILYLFSGGWRPGIPMLRTVEAKTFSSIYLVDIWMDDKGVATFYKALADKEAGRLTYIYTRDGAENDDARDYIAKKLGATKATLVDYKKGVEKAVTHMSTNNVAVGMLK
jgi:hypothetical protein